MKKIYLLLYYLFVNKMPSSHFPGGVIFNKIRIFFVKRIIIIGLNNKFQRNIYFGDGNNVVIGNNCQINDNIRLDNVKIGNNVMIARDTVFIGKSHNFDDFNTPMNEQGFVELKQTVVENDVWIGLRAIIMPGVEIKSGSIIAAGTVLTKSTVKNGIYAGIPGKLIRIRKTN